MPTITIDGREIPAREDGTILEAARAAGIEIPTLCHMEGYEAGASCMVCAVKLKHSGQLIPSCASKVVDGMEIESASDDVRGARRMALELLFSDHMGDCLSPCQRICPAQLTIPAVLEHLRQDEPDQAAGIVRRDLALPGVLCRVCHRPCESGCRRGTHDEPVAIAELVLHAINVGATSAPSPAAEVRDERIAIIGSGFTGLSAAWFLARQGYRPVVFERADGPADSIRREYPDLPGTALAAELDLLKSSGVELVTGREIDDPAPLLGEFDAVLIATGPGDDKPEVDKDTMRVVGTAGIFAAGRVLRPTGKPVQSVADAKAVASCIDQHLRGRPVQRPPKPFSIFMGKLLDGEMDDFLKESSDAHREETVDIDHALAESRRCVMCHCAKADTCKLRQLAIDYEVNPKRYNTGERLRYSRNIEHPLVRFEPAKCIRCGNCIKVAGRHAEALGLTFIGRGFDVHLGVPFHGTLDEGLRIAAEEAIAACPTGALTHREVERRL
ncbi:FAD-dependent oxidoreductase [Haloferula sp. A504]|uniref:FAD-dependent oxidoreductase n=1 Tax=Haloferula sp. A504 TaxID=3373601 RepID=UPI0031C782BA|nr:FAD-dependent oxidoreductase [Verrucomicrobiaceae bacterium E54]